MKSKVYKVTYEEIVKDEKNIIADSSKEAIAIVKQHDKQFGRKTRNHKAVYIGERW